MQKIIPAHNPGQPGADVVACYLNSKHTSIKHSSYFQVYESLLAKFRHTRFTFVEIGILDGGSLFMWREYFGPQARIIGIDLNPDAKKWEAEGFEIFIGSQEDPLFWERFFAAVGDVDVVLDDGGHSNSQQVITAHHTIRHIRDGGMLIVEDTHTSYMKGFGNPSKYSFINYCMKIVELINSRSSVLTKHPSALTNVIYSCSFFESIVCFHIDRQRSFDSRPTVNNGASPTAKDYRFQKYKVNLDQSKPLASFVKALYLVPARVFSGILFLNSKTLLEKITSARLKKYFRG